MLIHFVAGPTPAGRYLVAYLTPGCTILTQASDCPSLSTAHEECARLNCLQVERKEAVRRDLELRGLLPTPDDRERKP